MDDWKVAFSDAQIPCEEAKGQRAVDSVGKTVQSYTCFGQIWIRSQGCG